MTHIHFDNIDVSYPVRVGGRERSTMAALAATASFGRIAGDMKKIPYVNAIRGLSLKVKSGDRLAVIGRNGAGKSTLLKTVSGIIHPISGTADIEGSILSLLSLGSGVNMEVSARTNLRLISRLLGIPKSELDAFTEDLLEFTELGEFFDLPLNTYSSGMLVRFMFGAVTYKPADIIVVDEVIGAGDAKFFKKAEARARELFKKSNILVLSTHSPDITYELCNRAIMMNRGEITMDGTPKEVWDAYHEILANEG
ncbi:ATP-binding cassette domain-containing protein [Hellea sp.]|nr:ATP-binding cassette domain-containing protein [Hellea sp.]